MAGVHRGLGMSAEPFHQSWSLVIRASCSCTGVSRSVMTVVTLMMLVFQLVEAWGCAPKDVSCILGSLTTWTFFVKLFIPMQ
jgi:hypothetical protein